MILQLTPVTLIRRVSKKDYKLSNLIYKYLPPPYPPIKSYRIIDWILKLTDYEGITFRGRIYMTTKFIDSVLENSQRYVNSNELVRQIALLTHEFIHVKQQSETKFFYFKYTYYYLKDRIWNHNSHIGAYMNIPFEKDARRIENKFIKESETLEKIQKR